MKKDPRQKVYETVNTILLKSTFADIINPSAKISEITTFGAADTDLIKRHIKSAFGLDIHQDISNFTVNQLVTMLFVFVCNSKSCSFLNKKTFSKKEHKTTGQTTAQKKSNNYEWNRRAIFSYVIGNLRTTMGRSVQSTEKIRDLIFEKQNLGKDPKDLTDKLQEMEKFFDIKIDQGMRIYNIGNAAEESLVAKGKAPDPRSEYESMEPLWATVYTALSINYWQNIILNELKVRISTYKLSRVKSFNEFEQLVAAAKQRKER